MTSPQAQADKSVLWHGMQNDEVERYARSKMLAFTKYMNPQFRINWHHRVICRYLDKFVKREINRLMIFVEPQTGKSELVSRHLPAFQFGLDPDHRWLSATYAESFGSELNIDVQKIMDTEKYRRLFPEAQIAQEGGSGNFVRNTSRFDIVGRRGRYYSMGVSGGMTGKTGYTLSIDDPVKGEKEVRAAAYREDQWRWLKTVARTRLRKDQFDRQPGILLTMTRWSHDDLAARIIAEMKAHPELPRWTILSFPAEREDMDDPLDPRKIGEPLWIENRNSQDLLELKADPRTWNSLYMQRPSPDQGTILQRDWWKFYEDDPEAIEVEIMVQSWDLTFTEGKATDFVCGFVLGKRGPKRYLLDRFKARVGFDGQITAIEGMSAKWKNAVGKYIEKAANGHAAKQVLDKKMSGVVLWQVKGSKVTRAEVHAPSVRAGNWYLPHPSKCNWTLDFIEECAEFPNGKHDDQVDAWSQGASILAEGPEVDFLPTSITGVSKWGRF